MHPLLRTLDLTASAGTESSVHDLHPIQQAAYVGSRRTPFFLSLSLTSLLIYGLSIGLATPARRHALRRAVDPIGRSVSLLLHDQASPPGIKPPVRNLVGPQGAGGEGHHEGTSTIDPRLTRIEATTLSMPSDAVDPDELGPSPKAERDFLSPNLALPLQTGGNGLAQGAGRDAARGQGGFTRRPKPVAVRDLQLVPTRQVPIDSNIPIGQESAAREPVRVRILIGEDGIPFEASIVSGPSFLHKKALKAALEWRFEPLGPHGLEAPFPVVLTFYPTILPPR